ncbi:MAG: adenylosuccinate synthase [Phycisphaerales bacterium]|nr:adenylosuccinate synthase [Phycisphaerales bacterium]
MDRITGHTAAVVGLQWGDEGKGKLVDLLANKYRAVVRYNGGANAGHSVVVGGERYSLHLVPSGILSPTCEAVIGNGVVVDPHRLLEEIKTLNDRGVDTSRLVISDRAHVVMPYHKAEDAAREELLNSSKETQESDASKRVVSAIGTTKRGIGPAYADKIHRSTAIRIGDLTRPEILRTKLTMICTLKNAVLGAMIGDGYEPIDAEELISEMIECGKQLAPMVKDTAYLLDDLRNEGQPILFEGANATMLDVDHGTYPFVTSSNSSALGIGAGSGVPPQCISQIIGVVKAYSTRVGGGPMPTELFDSIGDGIRERGREFGTTTGRPRRVGWLDLVAVKYSAMVSGATELCITLLDVLASEDELKIATQYKVDGKLTDRFLPDGYLLDQAEPVYETMPGFSQDITAARSFEELPAEARAYIEKIEQFVGVPVKTVSVGPDREQTILRESVLETVGS